MLEAWPRPAPYARANPARPQKRRVCSIGLRPQARAGGHPRACRSRRQISGHAGVAVAHGRAKFSGAPGRRRPSKAEPGRPPRQTRPCARRWLPKHRQEVSSLAKAEWGSKRECPSCGTRYYDLGNEPPVCPRCGTAYTAAAVKLAATPAPAVEKPKPKPKPAPRAAEEAEEAEAAVVPETEEDAAFDDEEDFVEEEEAEVFEPEEK
ncbi:MAG: TIGR02300 family protein [Alphaproteobacteria bacterium]|nr:TIGR02300 family protein [Alphaproteobacteria bacterium]